MHSFRQLLLAVLAAALAPTAAIAAGAVKAAFVEEAVPSRPFSAHMDLSRSTPTALFGPVSGILGLTSITLTNNSSVVQKVVFFSVRIALAGTDTCTGTPTGRGHTYAEVYVPPMATLHLPFPTPAVVTPVDGVTCILATIENLPAEDATQVYVYGLVN